MRTKQCSGRWGSQPGRIYRTCLLDTAYHCCVRGHSKSTVPLGCQGQHSYCHSASFLVEDVEGCNCIWHVADIHADALGCQASHQLGRQALSGSATPEHQQLCRGISWKQVS